MKINQFEDVIAWQKARELNIELRKTFCELKDFSFKDQILRAGLSINNNIAEGFERGSVKELSYFLIIARGSNSEVRSMLYSALDFGYIDKNKQHDLIESSIVIGKLLTGFIKKLKTPE